MDKLNSKGRSIATLMPWAGFVVSAIGICGLLAQLFDFPLLGYGHGAFQISLNLIFLGLGIITILPTGPSQGEPHQTPFKHWRALQATVILIPGLLSLYHLANFTFFFFSNNPPSPSSFMLEPIPPIPAICGLLMSVCLFLVLKKRNCKTAMVCGVGLAALSTLNLSLLIGISYILARPETFNLEMTLAGVIGYTVASIAVLIGTLPDKGLILPLVSPRLQSKVSAWIAFLSGLAILLYGGVSIAWMMLFKGIPTIADLHVYLGAEIVTVTVAVILKMVSLRAIYHADQAASLTEALQETEARYKRVIDGSNEGIWDWDVQTDRVYRNSRLSEIIGFDPDTDVPIELFNRHVYPEDLPQLEQAISNSKESGEPFVTVFRFIRPDGEIRHLISKGKSIRNAEGTPVRMAGVTVDVTGPKQAEAEIQRLKEEAEEANRQKTKVLSFVSHDFKNPLASISRFIELLEHDKDGRLSETQREYLSYMTEGIDQLRRMVLDILDKARLEEGKVIPMLEPIAIEPFISHLEPLFLDLTAQQHVALNIVLQPGFETLEADPTHLRQILINLISNATKYNRLHGKIDLRFKTSTDRQWVLIEVQDTGTGISPEKLPSLFTEYYRAANLSQINAIEGTGLGLAFIKKLVELHGGRLSVESEVGYGSTFTVMLPLTNALPLQVQPELDRVATR